MVFNLMFCIGLILFVVNIIVIIYAPAAGAWLSVGVGIVESYLLFMMFFVENSTMVIFSKANNTVTVFRYFAMGRKEIQMLPMNELFNVYPIEVKNQYGTTQGFNIVLEFKFGETLKFFTSDSANFFQYVEEIDQFCLNGTAPRNTNDNGTMEEFCNGCCNAFVCPNNCSWLLFAFMFLTLAYIGIFFVISFAWEGARFWNEDGNGGVDRKW